MEMKTVLESIKIVFALLRLWVLAEVLGIREMLDFGAHGQHEKCQESTVICRTPQKAEVR